MAGSAPAIALARLTRPTTFDRESAVLLMKLFTYIGSGVTDRVYQASLPDSPRGSIQIEAGVVAVSHRQAGPGVDTVIGFRYGGKVWL